MTEFNFDDFINGTKAGTCTTHLYRVDNTAEITELEASLDDDALGGDDRLGAKPEAVQIAQRIKELADEMEASKVDVVVRPLKPSEFKVLREAEGKDMAFQLSLQAVEPRLTEEQWTQVAEAVGWAQWARMCADVNEFTLGEVKTPDFSPAVSRILTPGHS